MKIKAQQKIRKTAIFVSKGLFRSNVSLLKTQHHQRMKHCVLSNETLDLNKPFDTNMPVLRIFCWALIFILRLRFPPGSSITSIVCLDEVSGNVGDHVKLMDKGDLTLFRKITPDVIAY